MSTSAEPKEATEDLYIELTHGKLKKKNIELTHEITKLNTELAWERNQRVVSQSILDRALGLLEEINGDPSLARPFTLDDAPPMMMEPTSGIQSGMGKNEVEKKNLELVNELFMLKRELAWQRNERIECHGMINQACALLEEEHGLFWSKALHDFTTDRSLCVRQTLFAPPRTDNSDGRPLKMARKASASLK